MNRNIIIGILIGAAIVLAVVMFTGMNNATTVDTSHSPPVTVPAEPAPATP